MDAALDAAMARETGEPGAAELRPEGWRAELDAHLEGCPRCRQLWTQLGAAHAALRVPRPVPVPAGMLAEFHRRAAEAPRPIPVRPQPWLWIWPLASAAAGATAAWIIAARVAPLPAQTHLDLAVRNSTRPPVSTPEAPPPTVHGHPAQRARPPAAAPSPNTGGGRKNPFTPNTEPNDIAAAIRPRFGGDAGYTDFAAKPQVDRLAGAATPRLETNNLAEGLPARDKGGEESLALRPKAQVMAQRVTESENRPVTLNVQADANLNSRGDMYANLSNAQDPPELRVSPAVLTALQRTVEPAAATTSVQQAAAALAQAADVAVEVDPRVAHRTVTLAENGVPLWRALEVVAEQSQAQVLPVRDHLVLKPLPAVARMPRVTGNVRLDRAPAGPAAAPATAAAAKPLGRTPPPAAPAPIPEVQSKVATAPTEPRLEKRAPAAVGGKAGSAVAAGQRGAQARAMDSVAKQDRAPVQPFSVMAAGATPDRKVWGEAWGTLPERGFAVPSPEEIPPQTLGLDAARNAEPTQRQTAPGQQPPNNVLRRNRQQNSR